MRSFSNFLYFAVSNQHFMGPKLPLFAPLLTLPMESWNLKAGRSIIACSLVPLMMLVISGQAGVVTSYLSYEKGGCYHCTMSGGRYNRLSYPQDQPDLTTKPNISCVCA